MLITVPLVGPYGEQEDLDLVYTRCVMGLVCCRISQASLRLGNDRLAEQPKSLKMLGVVEDTQCGESSDLLKISSLCLCPSTAFWLSNQNIYDSWFEFQ